MAKKVLPIKPEDVFKEKKNNFPNEVISTFNKLIAEKMVGESATINQDEVVAELVKQGLPRKEIFDKGWLNVEDIYRAEGWVVEYDKPGYNESYAAYFTFKRKQ